MRQGKAFTLIELLVVNLIDLLEFPEVFIFSTFVLTFVQVCGVIILHIQELRLSVSNVSFVGV